MRKLKLTDPNSVEKIELLAQLFTNISDRWNNRENVIKYIQWELEGNMSYQLVMKKSKPIGYCGLEQKELLSGDIMYWIKEIGVHPKERGRNIATSLLKSTIDSIKNKGRVKRFISILIQKTLLRVCTEDSTFKLWKKFRI